MNKKVKKLSKRFLKKRKPLDCIQKFYSKLSLIFKIKYNTSKKQ